jgi:epoxide hydrolase-like predicted phosphatase
VIKNIIFDLGNVLVHVDFAKSRRLLLSAGVKEKDFKRFFTKKNRRSFELGKITTNEFMDLAYYKLGKKVSKARLKLLFTDMFCEITEMKEFLQNLSKRKKYRLFLMSNTNPLHFNYAQNHFPYIKLFDVFILSYRMKMVKPDKRLFKAVINKYNLVPEETLFIDDLEENCRAAGDTGLKTICYKNYRTFVKQFEKIVLKNQN